MWLVGVESMMITEFRIKYVKNSLITSDILEKIIGLKKQYWHYSFESHKKWMKENINDDDYHLWIENNSGRILAYLNMIFFQVQFNKIFEEVVGVGNVCVSNEISGKGIGLLLMQICNYYVNYHEKRAILLCKKSLSYFYRKSGWNTFQGEVLFLGNDYNELVMLNELPSAINIAIERNF